MAIKETRINRFDGGMNDNPRLQSTNSFQLATNFDIANSPEILKPNVGTEKNSGSYTTTFGVYRTVLANGNIYGLGVKAEPSTLPKIFKLSSPLDAFNSTWSSPANSEATSGGFSYTGMFTYYKDYIYITHDDSGSNSKISRYGSISGTPTFTTAWKTMTVGSSGAVDFTSDGVIGIDDNLYFAYRTTDGTQTGLGRIDGTNLVEAAITVPSNYRINQLVTWNKYLCMICSSVDKDTNSKMFIWDYISPDITEVVDLGWGDAMAADVIDGTVVIFVNVTGFSISTSRPSFIRVLTYSGGTPTQIFKIKGQNRSGSSYTAVTSSAYSYRSNIYVGSIATIANSSSMFTNLLLRVGRKDNKYQLSYSFDYDCGSQSSNGGGISDFIFFNENIIIANVTGTRTSDIYITVNGASYVNKSVYESQIFNGESNVDKQLHSAFVNFVALPSAGQVILQYRKDEETTWTTIFTDTTDNAISHESVNIESTGVNLPTFREIQFRIESTGGAEITALGFTYEELSSISN